jgi:hypothetical protein
VGDGASEGQRAGEKGIFLPRSLIPLSLHRTGVSRSRRARDCRVRISGLRRGMTRHARAWKPLKTRHPPRDTRRVTPAIRQRARAAEASLQPRRGFVACSHGDSLLPVAGPAPRAGLVRRGNRNVASRSFCLRRDMTRHPRACRPARRDIGDARRDTRLTPGPVRWGHLRASARKQPNSSREGGLRRLARWFPTPGAGNVFVYKGGTPGLSTDAARNQRMTTVAKREPGTRDQVIARGANP